MIKASWADFLHRRGVDPAAATVTRFTAGEINDTWRIDVDDHHWVLRRYLRTDDPDDLDCELAAIDHLSRSGFPTPAVIGVNETTRRRPQGSAVDRSQAAGERQDHESAGSQDHESAGSQDHGSGGSQDDGSGKVRRSGPRWWDWVDGRPTALFAFAPGEHPAERPGGYGTSDLALGLRAAQLAGRLHRTMDSARVRGRRSPDRDPWRQIGRFLAGPSARLDLFAELIAPLRQVHQRLAPLYRQQTPPIPYGLVHNDIRPPNLLLGTDGEITALLDFDDCLESFLGYEFGALVGNFGKDDDRRVVLDRVCALIMAYDGVRPLTTAEREQLPDLLIAHAGAEGVRVVSHWLAGGNTDVALRDSYSVRQFLDLVHGRELLAAAL